MKRDSFEFPDVDEQREGPRSCNTDYRRCIMILCQKVNNQKFYNVILSGLDRITTAAEAWQDEPAIRLKWDIGSETCLQEKTPLWHAEWQNIYILRKSFKPAMKRCTGEASSSSQVCNHSSECSTHSSVPKVDMQFHCTTCSKVSGRHAKQPKYLVVTDTWQQSLLRKAHALQDHAIALHIRGYSNEATDIVAHDLYYHMPCMNRYTAQRT